MANVSAPDFAWPLGAGATAGITTVFGPRSSLLPGVRGAVGAFGLGRTGEPIGACRAAGWVAPAAAAPDAAPVAVPAATPAALPAAVPPAARLATGAGSFRGALTFGLIWVVFGSGSAILRLAVGAGTVGGATDGAETAEAAAADDPDGLEPADFSLAGLVSPSRSRSESFGFASAGVPQFGAACPFGAGRPFDCPLGGCPTGATGWPPPCPPGWPFGYDCGRYN